MKYVVFFYVYCTRFICVFINLLRGFYDHTWPWQCFCVIGRSCKFRYTEDRFWLDLINISANQPYNINTKIYLKCMNGLSSADSIMAESAVCHACGCDTCDMMYSRRLLRWCRGGYVGDYCPCTVYRLSVHLYHFHHWFALHTPRYGWNIADVTKNLNSLTCLSYPIASVSADNQDLFSGVDVLNISLNGGQEMLSFKNMIAGVSILERISNMGRVWRMS